MATVLRLPLSPPLVTSLSHEELGTLLRDCGHEVESVTGSGGHRIWGARAERFGAVLMLESARERGRFRGIVLATHEHIFPEGAAIAARALEPQLVLARTRLHDRGGILLLQRIVLHGGVTRAHLGELLGLWRVEMALFRRAVAEACGLAPRAALH